MTVSPIPWRITLIFKFSTGILLRVETGKLWIQMRKMSGNSRLRSPNPFNRAMNLRNKPSSKRLLRKRRN